MKKYIHREIYTAQISRYIAKASTLGHIRPE